jgi:hypothetical protein
MAKREKHGFTGTRVYHIWRQMRYRCSSPKAPEYKNYGGRGIKVCKRWDSFNNFLADMGEPEGNLTLERKDNSKGYSPGNCKWATYKEQLNNRRDNNRLTVFGKTQTITQWAEEYKLPVSTLRNRLFRAKMAPAGALLAPVYAQQRGKPVYNKAGKIFGPLFYEGDDPKAFCAEIKANFDFDPSEGNSEWNKRGGYHFTCLTKYVHEIRSKYPIGT